MNIGRNSKGTKTSSFWLDPVYLKGSKYQTKEEKESGDLLKMASVRRSISNFVSIVTGKNIPVKFASSGMSATNGKYVTISADLVKFDTVCGLALHEASHIKLSNFRILERMGNDPESFFSHKFLNKMAKKYDMSTYDVARLMVKRLKSFTNWLEDRRIDNYIYTNAPGYQGYYESMYNEYWNSTETTEGLESEFGRDEVWESYEYRVINLTNPKTDLNALKGLKKIWEIADLKNIGSLNNTKDVLAKALEMLEVVESYTTNNPPTSDEEEGEGSEGEGDGEEGESGESTSEPSKGEGKGSKSKEESEEESESGNGGEGDDSDEDEDGDTEGSDGENENESEGDDNGNDVDGESSNSPAERKSSEVDKNADNGTPNKAPKKLTEKEVEKLVDAIEKQKEFLEGEVEKDNISDEKKDMVEAMEEAGTEEKQVAKNHEGLYDGKTTATTIVMKQFNDRILKSDPFGIFLKRPEFENEVTEGFKLGRMLGKKIQIRNEERTLKTSRLRNGKIDDRLIHSLGYGAEQVFERTFTDVFNPLHLHISIDASGSMSGRKWTQTMVAVTAIAKAASMVSNLDVVISFRYTGYANHNGGWHHDHKPLVLIAYDSKKDDITKVKRLFPYLNSPSATPEGLCFEGIMDLMVEGNANQDSYFINFSDGQPYFSNSQLSYSGTSARKHTKKMVDQMRSRGIKILSYYIGGGMDDMESFRTMYGKDAENVDVTSLIPLAKTLNKLFTKK